MEFEKITNQDLDNLPMSDLSDLINLEEYKKYFLCNSSIEHYRLLSYISLSNDNITLLDIGTLKGSSALAMSINPKNKVVSFDVSHNLDLSQIPQNVTFLIDDVTKLQYRELVLESKYILLDTYHDGTFEKVFYDYLKEINYKGFLLLDDINLNQEMISFWNQIDLPKIDISSLGHITGTGVVTFN